MSKKIEDYMLVEKVRLKLKFNHEGGLYGMLNYGIPPKMYELFPEIDELFNFYEKLRYTKKQQLIFDKVECEINDYFENVPDYEESGFTDDELNDVNYIFG